MSDNCLPCADYGNIFPMQRYYYGKIKSRANLTQLIYRVQIIVVISKFPFGVEIQVIYDAMSLRINLDRCMGH